MNLQTREQRSTSRLANSLILTMALSSLLGRAVSAEELTAPQNVVVERTEGSFRGSWSAVKGASFYEVWVEKFGRWGHNDKEMEFTPFTSSFQIPIEDERSRFKVRAVDPQGQQGPFSEEVGSTRARETSVTPDPVSVPGNSTGTPGGDKFDPKAPAPPPPTSLFAVWTEQEVIKLVWREPKGGKTYSVEEEIDGKWVSIPRIEFSKPNTAIIKGHPAPGPYRFRVRSVGANGRASEPSFPTTAKR